MKQYYEKLEVSREWPEWNMGLMSISFTDNSLIVYCDCGSDEEMHTKLSFGVVAAFQAHEEFTHPDMERLNSENPPKGKSNGFYPLLEVRNSHWKKSFTEYRLAGNKDDFHHYQILSGSNIIDVLAIKPPEITWVTGDDLLRVEAFLDDHT